MIDSQPDGPVADSCDGYKLRGDEFDEGDDIFSSSEEEEEPDICPTCRGCGEGQYEGTRCSTCHGSGQIETEAQRAAREDEEDHAAEIREELREEESRR